MAPPSAPSAPAPLRSLPWPRSPQDAGLARNICKPQGEGRGVSPCPPERGNLAGSPRDGGCGVPSGCQSPEQRSCRGGGKGLTLGMASSSRNLALLRRAARRFCCWSCRGSRLQSKGGVRLPGCPRGSVVVGGRPGEFGISPVFMDVFAFPPLLQLAGAALAPAGGFLWQHLAGGVRRDADPQAKDAFLLFDFLPTQKPGWQRGGNNPQPEGGTAGASRIPSCPRPAPRRARGLTCFYSC